MPGQTAKMPCDETSTESHPGCDSGDLSGTGAKSGRVGSPKENAEEAPARAAAVYALLEHAMQRQHAGAHAEARADEAGIAGRIVAA